MRQCVILTITLHLKAKPKKRFRLNTGRRAKEDAIKHFSAGCVHFSQCPVSHWKPRSPLCKSGACFEWRCELLGDPLRPNPAAAKGWHPGCETGSERNSSVGESRKTHCCSTEQQWKLEDTTFLREGLCSLVDGDDRDENFSLERGFMPSSSRILLCQSKHNTSVLLLLLLLLYFTANLR